MNYKNYASLEEYFTFLKSSTNQLQRFLKCIQVDNVAFLLPMSETGVLSHLKSHGDCGIAKVKDVLVDKSEIIWEIVNSDGIAQGFILVTALNGREILISPLECSEHPHTFTSLDRVVGQIALNFNGLFELNNCYLKYSDETVTYANWTVSNGQYLEWDPEEEIGKELILTAGPSISALESTYAYDASTFGWNSQASKYLDLFEEQFAAYIGTKYAIATSSCTGALQIALLALEIGVGDEVIVPDLTWVATANAVRYTGATPIFADVDMQSWTLDPSSVERLITPKTKAIIPVHMYGHPTDMSRITELADRFNIPIVEDAAPAIGAKWQNRNCGTFGSFAAFSFQGAKLLVTGEGGMLVTDNEILYEKARKIWDQGRNPQRAFWIDEKGVKFKMANVQAAIGLGQLQRADELIGLKRRIFSWYEEVLADNSHLTLNKEVRDAKSIYWMSSIYLHHDNKISRDELITKLRSLNIDSRPVFPAISQYPIWENYSEPQQNANSIGMQALNLPSGVKLTRNQVRYVAQTVDNLLQ